LTVERHNRLAPELVRKLISETDDESACLITLESVVLGVMLYYRRDVREASEFLDVLTERVVGRMSA
jgi:hypothetical protein